MSESSLPPRRVLLIADDPTEADRLRALLAGGRGAAFELESAGSLTEASARLATGGVDVVLLELSAADGRGSEPIAAAERAAQGVPVVVLGEEGEAEAAAGALRRGAPDYLVKHQIDGYLLSRALLYAVERRQLADERRALERQKDDFFANVSHDLRSPLFAIKLSVGVLQEHQPAEMPDPLRRLVGNIEAATDELTRLVDDLLELSRLQGGRLRLRLAACDLSRLVARVARTVEPLVAASGQQVVLRAPPDRVVVEADAARLERALRKLLDNAIRLGPAGGTVRLRLSRIGSDAVISVSDEGPGLAPDEHERIFERYYQPATAAAAPRRGSGLGLAIARALVDLHGGQLSVESQPGAGTTFLMTVPVRAPVRREAEAESDEDFGR